MFVILLMMFVTTYLWQGHWLWESICKQYQMQGFGHPAMRHFWLTHLAWPYAIIKSGIMTTRKYGWNTDPMEGLVKEAMEKYETEKKTEIDSLEKAYQGDMPTEHERPTEEDQDGEADQK